MLSTLRILTATHPPMAKSTLSFVCQNCGAAYNRWQGKCESCGEWNTLAEEDTTGATSMPVSIRSKRRGRTFALESLTGKSADAPRLSSGMAELDRVTGGGFVRGSVLLVGGDPGIGKSTLADAGHQPDGPRRPSRGLHIRRRGGGAGAAARRAARPRRRAGATRRRNLGRGHRLHPLGRRGAAPDRDRLDPDHVD